MKKEWQIKNGILVLKLLNGVEYIPTAAEVFSAEVNVQFIHDGVSYNSPKNISNIRFSKIGLPIKIKLQHTTNYEDIELKIFAQKAEKEYEIKLTNGFLPDHLVVENVWHFLSINFDKVSEIIKNYNIIEANPISLKTYFSIKKYSSEIGLSFEDCICNKNSSLLETTCPIPYQLKAKLYPYQEVGYQWLKYMNEQQCGCVLGDEMGLGKSLQIITLLARLKESNSLQSILIIAPVSLLENWKREFENFYPTMDVYIHHGSGRTGFYNELLEHDVILMSYSNVQSDLSMLTMINWDFVILDEAQNIKNPFANRTKSVKKISKRIGIAVTGTPFENHITDIWSIIDFAFPGYLGTLSEFENIYDDSSSCAFQLEKLISPLILRRNIKDVAKDLPEKIDIPQAINMSEIEAIEYEKLRSSYDLADQKTITINSLQKLRMYCTHPQVAENDLVRPVEISMKYCRLCDILGEIFTRGDKAIVFTSFNDMFEIFRKDIPSRFGVRVFAINGSTPQNERQSIVDTYSSFDSSALLILNPRAAGTGLNITAANHIIHYNLEWNPAIEDQASARAYRRGQQKTVFIYRLFYANTIEEVINEKIERKRDLFEAAIVGNQGKSQDKADLIRALKMSPFGGLK